MSLIDRVSQGFCGIVQALDDGAGALLSSAAHIVTAAVDVDTYVSLVADPYLVISGDVPFHHVYPTLARTFAPTDEQYTDDRRALKQSYFNPAFWVDHPLTAFRSFAVSVGSALPASAAIACGAAPEAFGIGTTTPAVAEEIAAAEAPALDATWWTLVEPVEVALQRVDAATETIDRALASFQNGVALGEATSVRALVARQARLLQVQDALRLQRLLARQGWDIRATSQHLVETVRADIENPLLLSERSAVDGAVRRTARRAAGTIAAPTP